MSFQTYTALLFLTSFCCHCTHTYFFLLEDESEEDLPANVADNGVDCISSSNFLFSSMYVFWGLLFILLICLPRKTRVTGYA